MHIYLVIDPAVEAVAKRTLVDTEIGKPTSTGEYNLVIDAPGKGLPAGASYAAKILLVSDNTGL